MNILHIISQYTASKVYKELIKSISETDNIYQEIYIPMRSNKLNGKYKIEDCKDKINYHYRLVYNGLDRILYYTRLFKIIKAMTSEIDIESMDFIHAHTLFADGGLAYLLNKKYAIPYIVSVRSTDIRGYLRKMPHCMPYLKKIIKNATNVILISPNMKPELEKYLDKKTKKILNEKILIKPNGIEEYWHKNINISKNIENNKKVNFVQVSELNKNKNLYTTINVIKKLKDNNYEVKLTVIGTGKEEKKYKEFVIKNNLEEYVKFLGYITDKEQLKNIYRENDIFIMLSKRETFGLVYVEAMSQGLPIIHTKGTGIDGYFKPGEVGYPLELKNIDNCTQIVRKIINEYRKISKSCIENAEKFQWKEIAKDYIELYRKGNKIK